MSGIVANVSATWCTATPCSWYKHTDNRHHRRVVFADHYEEGYHEHINEVARYDQTRHAGNENDWEGVNRGEEDVDDGSKQ